MSDLPVVVVVSGPNGLVAAISPAAEGLPFSVREKHAAAGGGAKVRVNSVCTNSTHVGGFPLTRVLKSPCSGKMAAPLARPHCECQHK